MKSSGDQIYDFESDIAIIGSGSGLAAAIAAAESGVERIVVLEKQGTLGGHTRIAQGLFACESPIQKRENIIADKDECFKTLMRWHHWVDINPRVARAYINKSGDTIRWFQKKGVDFDIKMWYPSQKIRGFHWPLKGKGPEYGGGAELIKVLTRDCKEYGVELLLHTSGKSITRRGNFLQIKALKDKQGIEVKAKAVIIATGIFAGNLELIKKYCHGYDATDIRLGELMKYHTGDGILMAEQIGAAIGDHIPLIYEGPAPDYPVSRGSLKADIREPIAGIVKEPYMIWVNKRGRRFVDETTGFMLPESANAILLQPDKLVYSMFDDRTRECMEKEGLLIGRGWGLGEKQQRVSLPGLYQILRRRATGEGKSLLMISDSLAEIATWVGAAPAVLQHEIDEYNMFCEQGYDAIFAKDRRFLWPLRMPPYYAIRCNVGAGGPNGGIIINENMEVVDKEGYTIPGVYATGATTSGLQARTYCGELCGSGLGFAMNSGRIAGECAAKFVSRS